MWGLFDVVIMHFKPPIKQNRNIANKQICISKPKDSKLKCIERILKKEEEKFKQRSNTGGLQQHRSFVKPKFYTDFSGNCESTWNTKKHVYCHFHPPNWTVNDLFNVLFNRFHRALTSKAGNKFSAKYNLDFFIKKPKPQVKKESPSL